MPSLAELQAWPPWPLSALIAYLKRLSDAFGHKYVAAVVLCYGVNQGIGEGLVYYARRYYLLDDVGLPSKDVGQLLGFAGIPWQLKSLFGLLSDCVPINGLHRSPYMTFAGVLGVLSTMLLVAVPPTALAPEFYAVMLLLININFSMPDVMIDATVRVGHGSHTVPARPAATTCARARASPPAVHTVRGTQVAERSKLRPDLAAELQALCWGAINTIGIPASIAKGYLYEAGGAKLIFTLCIGTAARLANPNPYNPNPNPVPSSSPSSLFASAPPPACSSRRCSGGSRPDVPATYRECVPTYVRYAATAVTPSSHRTRHRTCARSSHCRACTTTVLYYVAGAQVVRSYVE